MYRNRKNKNNYDGKDSTDYKNWAANENCAASLKTTKLVQIQFVSSPIFVVSGINNGDADQCWD
jgi:hypothetical protein